MEYGRNPVDRERLVALLHPEGGHMQAKALTGEGDPIHGKLYVDIAGRVVFRENGSIDVQPEGAQV